MQSWKISKFGFPMAPEVFHANQLQRFFIKRMVSRTFSFISIYGKHLSRSRSGSSLDLFLWKRLILMTPFKEKGLLCAYFQIGVYCVKKTRNQFFISSSSVTLSGHCGLKCLENSESARKFRIIFLICSKDLQNARWTKTIKELWVCMVWTVLWGIWRERNSRIFNSVYESFYNLWDKILYWLAIWVKSCKDFNDISFLDLSMGWSFLL